MVSPLQLVLSNSANDTRALCEDFGCGGAIICGRLALLPFKNHEVGLKAFSYAVTNYTSEPAPKHFAEALAAVIADDSCKPPQTDPLGIIPAWEAYEKVRPLIFSKKAVMSAQEISLKDAVDKRFITYMQVC